MNTDAAVGEVFNIGGTEEISVLELADRVRVACASGSEIRLIPYEEAFDSGFEDMRRRVPDTSKIERLLGWRTTHALAEILDDVIESQRTADAVAEIT